MQIHLTSVTQRQVDVSRENTTLREVRQARRSRVRATVTVMQAVRNFTTETRSRQFRSVQDKS